MRTLHLLLLFFTAAAAAGENRIVLKDGQGKESVMRQCAICHSLDYIVANDSVLDKAGWRKTVDKMIYVMGAPIDDTERRIIVDYLAQRYGK
jgi:cytochrome c5